MPKVFKWIPSASWRIAGMTIFLLLISSQPTFAQTPNLNQLNQTYCDRFEEDTARLAAIMDEIRRRKGIKETRVAYGNIHTQIETADYWVTYAAEAIAYQKSKSYSSKISLKSDLTTLQGKVLKAKTEVKKALDEK